MRAATGRSGVHNHRMMKQMLVAGSGIGGLAAALACARAGWQVRVLERDKQLLDKIDQALQRLARGEYGWCSETGEPIGLPRLLLRPTATLCIEAKARQELREKHIRERRGNTYE